MLFLFSEFTYKSLFLKLQPLSAEITFVINQNKKYLKKYKIVVDNKKITAIIVTAVTQKIKTWL